MTISYCTTIWTHHQSALCSELHRIWGDDFKMVITQPLKHVWSIERINMGWNIIPPKEGWIVGPPETEDDARSIDYRRLICDVDVAIIGFLPCVDFSIVKERINSGKLTFFQRERIYKKKIRFCDYLSLSFYKLWVSLWLLYRPKNVYFLTLSHWCKKDLRFLHVCRNRIIRWGYLVSVSSKMCVKSKSEKVKIGWCGRMIDWKRVDLLIRAYAQIDEVTRKKCTLSLVGDGDQKEYLSKLAVELGVGDVEFLNSVKSADAVSFMQTLDIYVMPSNREEGWGAALLEAMDCGCAVIANEAAGATLDLIEDGKNGFSFRDGDIKGLAVTIKRLVDNAELRKSLGAAAWSTMQQWSPNVGAERLLGIMDALFNGRALPMYRGLGELVG